MAFAVDDLNASIARRIRLERDIRGWSLAALSKQAGVSKAAISKIERGETSPTAAVLMKLAGAFDLTLAGFFIRAEGAERVSRAADQPVWRDTETGYIRRQVFARSDHPLELVEVDLPAGARVELPASSYASIRQALLVLKGEVSITEGVERTELAAGDCLGFGPPSDVTFHNGTDRTCTYLVAITRS